MKTLDLKTLSLEELFRVFEFDFVNGKVYWKSPIRPWRTPVGTEAGSVSRKNDYWYIFYKNKKVKRGRLIYYAYHKKAPENVIDHINRNKLDDSIMNLREATVQQNSCNKTFSHTRSGLPNGVTKTLYGNKFRAAITVKKKQIYLGTYNDAASASSAYLKARKEYFGDFASQPEPAP